MEVFKWRYITHNILLNQNMHYTWPFKLLVIGYHLTEFVQVHTQCLFENDQFNDANLPSSIII